MLTFEEINLEINFTDVETAKKRIKRYTRLYPGKDLLKYAKKIKLQEDLVRVKEELEMKLRLSDISGTYIKSKVAEILSDKKFLNLYLKGDLMPYEKLKSYINGNRVLELHNCDFRDSEIKNETIDIIITDPPYPRQFLSLYRDLAVYAARVLKPGGSLFAMAGQSYLPEIMNLMQSDELRYNWTLCYLTPGGQSPQLWQRKVNSFWKPILWYVKGEPSRWLGDVVKSDVNDNDKRFHYWGQSISGMSDLVNRVSSPGDLVLDPFMGGGATGAACLMNLRNFVGVELDKEAFLTSEIRLNELSEEILKD